MYLMVNNDMEVIMKQMNACVIEYGLKVNEKKSTVVCINGEVGKRRWMIRKCYTGEVEEYKYLGGFESMGVQLNMQID